MLYVMACIRGTSNLTSDYGYLKVTHKNATKIKDKLGAHARQPLAPNVYAHYDCMYGP